MQLLRRLLCLLFFCVPIFGAKNMEESFLLLEGEGGTFLVEQGPHLDERVTPACSFNIALSLMGYDSGILVDEHTPTWDFQPGYDDFLPSWQGAQTPLTWMGYSCLWYGKLLSLRLGEPRIQAYLDAFDYGNHDASGGVVPPGSQNPLWINSSLKISPREQIFFIRRMVLGELPVSGSTVAKAKLLLFKEVLPDGMALYGKTGLGRVGETKVRWFVGWIEDAHTFFPLVYQRRDEEVGLVQLLPRVKELLSR